MTDLPIISQRDAKAAGLARFFLGADRPCKRGHVAERFVSGGNCLECLAGYMAANRDKMRAYRAAYREANKGKARAQKAAYYGANKDRLKAKMVEYRVRRAGLDPAAGHASVGVKNSHG